MLAAPRERFVQPVNTGSVCRTSALRASVAWLLAGLLSGCGVLGSERQYGCEGDEKSALIRGSEELVKRVPGLVVEYYSGCDSGYSAYVAWEHPSFVRLSKQMSSLGCMYIRPTDPGSEAFDCTFSGQSRDQLLAHVRRLSAWERGSARKVASTCRATSSAIQLSSSSKAGAANAFA